MMWSKIKYASAANAVLGRFQTTNAINPLSTLTDIAHTILSHARVGDELWVSSHYGAFFGLGGSSSDTAMSRFSARCQ